MKTYFYLRAKAISLAILLIITSSIKEVYAQQFLTTIDGWNAYVHLPDDYYDGTNKKYPLICFIPGTGETGTVASKLLTYGPSKFIASGHNMQFMVNGVLEKPIVISLQPVALWPNAWTINKKLDSIFARYRCDLQRIYGTGLSMGGWSWDNYVDNYDPAYTNRITTIVSMSAPPPDNTSNAISLMRYYALAGGTAWFFEGNLDLRGNDKIRDTMNSYVPGSARYTLYSGGHGGWNTFYNPAYNENGESIYTWMLKQKKPANGNLAPLAYAGKDTAIATIVSTYNLAGSANDPDGNPINILWTKLQGPASGTISNPASTQTSVTGLVFGLYKFELKVTDAEGAVSRDTLVLADGMATLPVKLLEFTAISKNSSVLLQWKTASEINSSHFEIERGSSPSFFDKIATQSTAGNGFTETGYHYVDQYPEQGTNFYRLKMVDLDGSYEYSKTISITNKDTKSSTIAISSANLKNNSLYLNLSSKKEQNVSLILYGADGKKYTSSMLQLTKGSNLIYKPAVVQKGIYYVQLLNSTEKISYPIISNY